MKSSVGSRVLLSDMALFLQLAARLAAAPGSSPAFPPFLWASWRGTSPPQSEENDGGDPSMKDASVRVLSCKTRRLLLVPRPSVRTSSPSEAVAVLATCRVVCGCVADGRLPQPAAFPSWNPHCRSVQLSTVPGTPLEGGSPGSFPEPRCTSGEKRGKGNSFLLLNSTAGGSFRCPAQMLRKAELSTLPALSLLRGEQRRSPHRGAQCHPLPPCAAREHSRPCM